MSSGPPDPAVARATGIRPADPLPRAIASENILSATAVKPQTHFISCKVFDGRRLAGCVIESASGFTAWSKNGRLGVFATYSAAESAVRIAARAGSGPQGAAMTDISGTRPAMLETLMAYAFLRALISWAARQTRRDVTSSSGPTRSRRARPRRSRAHAAPAISRPG